MMMSHPVTTNYSRRVHDLASRFSLALSGNSSPSLVGCTIKLRGFRGMGSRTTTMVRLCSLLFLLFGNGLRVY